MLEHGGRLLEAARRYGIAPGQWLDLSTGINPVPWPVPPLPASLWQRLPEDGDGLDAVAAHYYGSEMLLPVAGSQQAIQALPRLFARQTIALVAPLYSEHALAWTRAGHRVARYPTLDEAVSAADIVVLCNPNNPDGRVLRPEALTTAAYTLAARGGWLVVDEAFMDATPDDSVVSKAGTDLPNLIVMRSLGKFFGLAGARVGFVFAATPLREALREEIGPWAVTGPSRWIAQQALADVAWHALARDALVAQAGALSTQLQRYGTPSGCALFQYLPCDEVARLYEGLASKGILVRTFQAADGAGPALRFGLPPDATALQRLNETLERLFVS